MEWIGLVRSETYPSSVTSFAVMVSRSVCIVCMGIWVYGGGNGYMDMEGKMGIWMDVRLPSSATQRMITKRSPHMHGTSSCAGKSGVNPIWEYEYLHIIFIICVVLVKGS